MGDLLLTCDSTLSEEDLGKLSLFKGYSEGLLLFAVSSCILYTLVGIPGNLITIIALARCEKIQNATTMFIMNLACSDMLFCCFNLPILSTMYWRRSWPFSMTMCRLLPMAGYGLVAVSLLSILAIMVNRYILIAYPRLYPKIYRTRYIAMMIFSIWIAAFAVLLPTWFEQWGRFGMDVVIESCSILPDCNNRSPKKFLFIGAFLIPCLLVLICYLRILWIVRNSAKRCSEAPSHKRYQRSSHLSQKHPESNVEDTSLTLQIKSISFSSACLETPGGINAIIQRIRQSFAALKQKRQPTETIRHSLKDRKVLQMVMTVIVSFWVCYLPITFIKLFRDFYVPPEPRVIGYVLVYLTTCINPIIYVVMSSEYRQAYKNLFMNDSSPNVNQATDTKNAKSQSKISNESIQNNRIYTIPAV